jgi:hypothetical protein
MAVEKDGRGIRTPDFFIVGAPKCGTTALNDYLAKHPEIFMAEKELHYFGTDIVLRYQRMKLEEYLGKFRLAGDKKRVGEASVWYLSSRKAALEIKEFCPHADIIIMLRNPVDMLYSLHSQLVYNGDEDIEDFEAALRAEEDRRRGLRIPRATMYPGGLQYRQIARYADQIKRYFDVFPREKILIILYDDLKNDTAAVYRDTLRFLKVRDDFQPELRITNPNKIVRSKELLNFLVDTPSGVMRLARTLMPEALRRKVKNGLNRLNTKFQKRMPMDPGMRQKLTNEFAPEIDRLGDLIGRDLSMWKR